MLIAATIGGVLAVVATIFSAIQIRIAGGRQKKIKVLFNNPERQKMPAQFEQTFKQVIGLTMAPPNSKVELLSRGINPGMRTKPFEYRIHVPSGQVIRGSVTRAELSGLIRKLEDKGVKINALY